MPSAGQKGLFFTSLSCTFVRFGRNLSTGKDKTMRKIETKKLAAAVTALALCAGVLTGCGGAASGTASSTAASAASSEASSEEADEMAAKNVAT